MSVLDGPRVELRRILHEGVPYWVRLEGEELVLGDGRRVREASATYSRAVRPDEDPLHPSELRVAAHRVRCAGPRHARPTSRSRRPP